MGQRYFYFAASLPMISGIDSECPMTTETFLNRCGQLLSREDSEVLSLVLAEDGQPVPSAGPQVRRIVEANRDFRNSLVWFRAVRAGRDPLDYLRGDRFNDPFWAEIANRALKMANLLEGKRLIDRTRWQALDDLVMGHFFDLEWIIVYGLKLKILERYQEIRSPKGGQMFNELKKTDTLRDVPPA